ncbi:MAG: SGNH/GDSL hydrolase family protein [Lacisediminihabitans sp.]
MSARLRRLTVVTVVISCTLLLTACGSSHALSTGTATSASAQPAVVTIGDSIMKGHGLPSADAWPALLAAANKWKLTNLACDGAGFVKTGDSDDCGSDFSELVSEAAAQHPALILISGSSNDLGIDNGHLAEQTDAVVKALRTALPEAKIVGISTVWNDTKAPTQMFDINEQVRQAMLGVGGIYLDIGQPLAGHRDWLQRDDVHPTAKGQRELAKAIAGALRSAKLAVLN